MGANAPPTSKRSAPDADASASVVEAARVQHIIDLSADFYWELDAHLRLTQLRPSTTIGEGELEQRLVDILLDLSSPAQSVEPGWQRYRWALASACPFAT
ncbi:MAG: hypothetical protein WDM77_20605 [Steroidobacteraceae bacterium]